MTVFHLISVLLNGMLDSLEYIHRSCLEDEGENPKFALCQGCRGGIIWRKLCNLEMWIRTCHTMQHFEIIIAVRASSRFCKFLMSMPCPERLLEKWPLMSIQSICINSDSHKVQGITESRKCQWGLGDRSSNCFRPGVLVKTSQYQDRIILSLSVHILPFVIL
jgi:hypothetical protein